MHLGTFPNGIEFATFVMTRQSYPFENMSVPDAEALFQDARATPPPAGGISGDWDGRLIRLRTPDTTLMNQETPVPCRVSFQSANGKTTGRCTSAGMDFTFTADAASVRMLGAKALLAKLTGTPRAGDTTYVVLTR